MSTTTLEIRPHVEIVNGQAKTTSLKVAEHFRKLHKDVLRKIENLECSPDFNRRNFAPVEFTDAKGEKRPAYEMTRDGFTFLAMGFTGKEAAKWKEAYIDAFNRMEAVLHAPAPRKPALPKPRVIKSRDDLSFTRRDSEGRLINWAVAHSPQENWHEGIEQGKAFFQEVVELAWHRPKDAIDAIRFAIGGGNFSRRPDTQFTGQHWGAEVGFCEAVARAAVQAILSAQPPQEGGQRPFPRRKED